MRVTGLPIISCAEYPKMASAPLFQEMMLPLLSADMMPSLAVSTTERKRSSLSSSNSSVRLFFKAIAASSPNAIAILASFSVNPDGLLARPIKPTVSPSITSGVNRIFLRGACPSGRYLTHLLFAKSLSSTVLPVRYASLRSPRIGIGRFGSTVQGRPPASRNRTSFSVLSSVSIATYPAVASTRSLQESNINLAVFLNS